MYAENGERERERVRALSFERITRFGRGRYACVSAGCVEWVSARVHAL